MMIIKMWDQDFSDTINCSVCYAMALKSMEKCPRCGASPIKDME